MTNPPDGFSSFVRCFRGQRAQSETIGVILVLGMVLFGTTLVVGFGAQALDASQQRSEVANAEQALAQFDSKAAQVALGDSSVQSVPLGSSGQYRVEPEAGTISIDESGTSIYDGTLGAVSYANGDTTIAYQGGGVWRRDESGGSVMLSPPEFHYRAGTLTLPIVSVKGSDVRTGRTSGLVSQDPGQFMRVFPSGSEGSRIEGGTITITIKSEYCNGWQQYFEERTNGDVTDCTNGETSIELVVPRSNPNVSSGIVSTAPAGELSISGGSRIDSYNSSDGAYAESAGSNGDVHLGSDLRVQPSATIDGSVVAAGGIDLGYGTEITGNASYGSRLGCPEYRDDPCVIGSTQQSGSAPSADPLDQLIERKAASARNSNDNGLKEAINSQSELDAGTYYIDELTLSDSQTLTLNTTDGGIDIIVDGDFAVTGSGTIDVVGQGEINKSERNRVNVYVAGDRMEFAGAGESAMNVPDDDASRLWIYGASGTDVDISGSGKITGVIYAPGTADRPSSITLSGRAQLYGAVVGKIETISGSAQIHYDEALKRTTTIETSTPITPIRFLHITENEVTVELR